MITQGQLKEILWPDTAYPHPYIQGDYRYIQQGPWSINNKGNMEDIPPVTENLNFDNWTIIKLDIAKIRVNIARTGPEISYCYSPINIISRYYHATTKL